jgi:hypothetical protein
MKKEKDMNKYRKKPVVIEAIQFTGSESSIIDIMALSNSRHIDTDCGGKELRIHTLEGVMTASLGDYIIKGVKGEVYPCKEDIFKVTYDEVEYAN